MESKKIIKQFLATEKSSIMKETDGKYVFSVDRRANKHQIRDAVEKLFNVHVDSVRTVIVAGKVKRLGRFEGKSSTWKKAIIKLKRDERINEFENL